MVSFCALARFNRYLLAPPFPPPPPPVFPPFPPPPPPVLPPAPPAPPVRFTVSKLTEHSETRHYAPVFLPVGLPTAKTVVLPVVVVKVDPPEVKVDINGDVLTGLPVATAKMVVEPVVLVIVDPPVVITSVRGLVVMAVLTPNPPGPTPVFEPLPEADADGVVDADADADAPEPDPVAEAPARIDPAEFVRVVAVAVFEKEESAPANHVS